MRKLLLVLLCFLMCACGTKKKDSEISDRALNKYKEDLVYIKTIYENGTEELQKIEITQEIDSKLFEVPSTYAEN